MKDIQISIDYAYKVTKELGGSGIWGVEFFIGKDGVYFSELSPRPHDTGMVTLAGTQNFTEFELHARAILGIPVLNIPLIRNGASAVVLAEKENNTFPVFSGLEEATNYKNTDFKIFGNDIQFVEVELEDLFYQWNFRFGWLYWVLVDYEFGHILLNK